MTKGLKISTYFALSWGILLNLAVVANLEIALPLAAGGQFESFPTAIRVVYLFQTFWLLFQFKIFHRLVNGHKLKSKWLINIFIGLGFIGFWLNLLSPSNPEKINSIALAITTYSFWTLRKN